MAILSSRCHFHFNDIRRMWCKMKDEDNEKRYQEAREWNLLCNILLCLALVVIWTVEIDREIDVVKPCGQSSSSPCFIQHGN